MQLNFINQLMSIGYYYIARIQRAMEKFCGILFSLKVMSILLKIQYKLFLFCFLKPNLKFSVDIIILDILINIDIVGTGGQPSE